MQLKGLLKILMLRVEAEWRVCQGTRPMFVPLMLQADLDESVTVRRRPTTRSAPCAVTETKALTSQNPSL